MVYCHPLKDKYEEKRAVAIVVFDYDHKREFTKHEKSDEEKYLHLFFAHFQQAKGDFIKLESVNF